MGNGRRAWVLTFTDLSALLLTFFVLSWSMRALHRPAPATTAEVDGSVAQASEPMPVDGPSFGSPSAELGARHAAYLVTLLDEELARAHRPCGLKASAADGFVEIRFRTLPPADRPESLCARAFRRLAALLDRLGSHAQELSLLELPLVRAPAVADILSELSALRARLENLLGFAPALVTPLAASAKAESVLRIGPL
ncbi:hypothetical protein HRbin40_02556 [bacterium HR40]|nr:hypothetical protein HRbin40_02556 [bacterium HR40]